MMATQEVAEAAAECAALVELLELRQGSLAASLDGGFPDLRATVWQSEASVQAALQQGVAATVLERLLPRRFKQYTKGISGRA